jgi:hypothetical protein
MTADEQDVLLESELANKESRSPSSTTKVILLSFQGSRVIRPSFTKTDKVTQKQNKLSF